MNTTLPVSALRWEQALFAFVRAELAPSATRWRAALRLTLLCALGTTMILAFQLPYGEFLLIFFFAVSQPDAWASFRKARLRGLGTLIGGGLAVVGIVAWGDNPALTLVVQAFLFAVALFLYRTTTIPYAVLLAMLTYVIATPVAATDPDASLEKVLWRILLTLAGAVIGTLAQLVLWPEHPEKLLLEQLAARLGSVQTIINRLANGGRVPATPRGPGTTGSAAATMAGQLDLLASAEAGSRWLQQRHTEQIKLITDVEMILITALRLERLAAEDPRMMETEPIRSRLRAIRLQLERVRQGLIERRVPGPAAANISAPAGAEPQAIASAITELESLLERMPVSLAFLPTIHTAWHNESHNLDPVREPIAEKSIFTPACRLSNREVVRFALKGALAATLCYLIYQALNWPGISTCVVTCLICSQSSFGAGLNKSLLRIAGATLGSLAAVATAVVLLPNIENAGAYLVVLSVLFFAASWLTVGSSRVSYIGLQVGLVLSLVLLNQPGRAIDLDAAGDRILGVLLGITMMGFIDLAIWPNFESAALRRKLNETVQALALIPRHMARQEWDEAGTAALAVHGRIAAALALYNEAQFEFGSPKMTSELDCSRFLALTNELEAAFLSLLVVLRHRRVIDLEMLPPFSQQRLHSLDDAIVRTFETLAAPTDDNIAAESSRQLSELAGEWPAPAVLAEVSETMGTRLSEYAVVCQELARAVGASQRSPAFNNGPPSGDR